MDSQLFTKSDVNIAIDVNTVSSIPTSREHTQFNAVSVIDDVHETSIL